MAASAPPDDREIFVTTSEAGQLLGISQRTVHYWILRGVLRSWTTEGGHRRIPMSEIHALLRKRQDSLDQSREITLLLVEDDEELAEMFRAMVASWKMPIRWILAGNGFDGLIQAGLHKPHIIISDLVMPAMDGFQMIRQLRKTPDLKETRLAVITGLSEHQIREGGGLPPDVEVFQKPVPFKEIKTMVEEVARVQLGKHRGKSRKSFVGEELVPSSR